LFILLLMCQPALAGQQVLLIRGLMDYMPGISPMTLLKFRLTYEGYDVTMITHLTDGDYKNQYWDAVIGHSQGAIDALRDAPDLARYNPHLTIITIDPPRTSVLFRCVSGVRYLDLHTANEFGLGGGSLTCPQASNVDMGGLHITLPMRSDAQEQILAFLSQDAPIQVAAARATHVSVSPVKPRPEPPKIADDIDEQVAPPKVADESDAARQILAYLSEGVPIEAANAKLTHLSVLPIKRKSEPPKVADLNQGTPIEVANAKPPQPPKVVGDDTSFDERFTAVWAGATNVLGPPVMPWTERSYAGVLFDFD
jgi:hypothetical protein